MANNSKKNLLNLTTKVKFSDISQTPDCLEVLTMGGSNGGSGGFSNLQRITNQDENESQQTQVLIKDYDKLRS
jgi:hypothetical protein